MKVQEFQANFVQYMQERMAKPTILNVRPVTHKEWLPVHLKSIPRSGERAVYPLELMRNLK